MSPHVTSCRCRTFWAGGGLDKMPSSCAKYRRRSAHVEGHALCPPCCSARTFFASLQPWLACRRSGRLGSAAQRVGARQWQGLCATQPVISISVNTSSWQLELGDSSSGSSPSRPSAAGPVRKPGRRELPAPPHGAPTGMEQLDGRRVPRAARSPSARDGAGGRRRRCRSALAGAVGPPQPRPGVGQYSGTAPAGAAAERG